MDKKTIQAEFLRAQLHAVYVAGYQDVVPKNFGDNHGIRPIRVGVTRVLADDVTHRLDPQSPFVAAGTLFRFWVFGRKRAERLRTMLMQALVYKTIPLRVSWRGLDPGEDVDLLRAELYWLAEDAGIEVMEDDEMIVELERMVRDKLIKNASI